MSRLIPIAARLAVAVLAGASVPVAAQDAYPSKPVRLIMPFPASGPADVMARLYAQKLSENWGGKAVVVDNRVGATGTIGADAVAKAAPDGYTLLFSVDLPVVMAPALFKTPYDPKKDLAPVAALGDGMNVLLVHPSVNIKTTANLLDAARAAPGKLTFSSAGNASPGHMCAELIMAAAGIKMTHVPYKGAAPAATAVLSGEVSMFCGPVAQGLPQIKAGKLFAVGTTGLKPSPLLPEVAPLSKTWPDVVVSNWYAVFAPSRTPGAVVSFLGAEMHKVCNEADVQKRLSGNGIDPLCGGPGELASMVERDLAKWTRVVKQAGIKAD